MIHNLDNFCLGKISSIKNLWYWLCFSISAFVFIFACWWWDTQNWVSLVFSINSFFYNLQFLPELFILLICISKIGMKRELERDLLPFLTAVINFQDAHPNLLYYNDPLSCTLQSVANLIRFSIFLQASKPSLKA